MKRLLGSRGVSAVMGLFLFATGASAPAQTPVDYDLKAAVQSADVDTSATPLGSSSSLLTKAVATVTGAVVQAAPAKTVTVALAPAIEKEASWLHTNGWPLYALVDRYATGAPLDEQARCMAVAVYHEARGESLEGQLAVARVIMNRAASGKYPASWCGTVKQPWQFSFVNPRTGDMPGVDEASASWRKALGITRLAVSKAIPLLTDDVLWYHADYVAPGWGRRLTRVEKIGTHIFYRA